MSLALDPELLAGEFRRPGPDGTLTENTVLDGIGRLLAPSSTGSSMRASTTT
jgi:hypothetical protein